ncbi:MAG: hypothetical protein LQ346_001648 [Caloplaca aetnensis]|nr:MAG: hypothetical protein LQ346_001648 [Caloplaca aetnensis]
MKDTGESQQKASLGSGFICVDANCGGRFASHKKLKKHIKSHHPCQYSSSNPTESSNPFTAPIESGVSEELPISVRQVQKATQAAVLADSGKKDEKAPLLSPSLRDLQVAHQAEFEFAGDKQPPASSVVGHSPYSPTQMRTHFGEGFQAIPASQQDGALPPSRVLQSEALTWNDSMSERLAMLERQEAESGNMELPHNGTKPPNQVHEDALATERGTAISDDQKIQLQEVRLGIQSMLTKYEGIHSQRIATLEKENAKMKDIMVLSVDALGKAESAHDEVLREKIEAQEKVEPVSKERDELKEQLAWAVKDQVASAAKAKIKGAEEMFRRMTGTGEWFLLASKVKMVEEEKTRPVIS